jgi:lauroyl/myristoyl acyltransferase
MSLREDGARLTAVYWAFRAAERAATTLPEPAGRRLFARLGRLAHDTLTGVRATVAANQAQVLGVDATSPLVRAATREAFDLYARYWYDTFHIRGLPRSELDRRTRMEGVDHIDAALADGKGCVAVLPHMGNWDVPGHWLAVRGYPIAAVAEVLKPPRLADLFVRHRERLAGLLADNWVVALVADRDLSGRGVEVEMFGATRRLPAGPALLSITSGAPLLVCPAYTTPDGWFVRIGEPLSVPRTGDTRADVRALSREMARAFERAIAGRPPDWHMFQAAWPP